MTLSKVIKDRFAPVLLVAVASIIISFATRLLLLLATKHTGITFSQGVGLFLFGLLYDAGVASVAVLPLLVYIWFQNNFIYKRKIVPWVVGAFALLLGLLAFTDIFPKDYNRQLYQAGVIYLLVRFLIYIGLCFLPYRFRIIWRRLILNFSVGAILFFLLFNAASEWFFWQEFSTRYNFTAVDNLMYANEVTGSIVQSYHTYFIIGAIAVIAILTTIAFYKMLYRSVIAPASFAVRTGVAVLLILIATATFYLPEQWRRFSKNEYANELAGNGLFQFAYAFQQKDLNFYQYYQTIPDKEAFSILRKDLQVPDKFFTNSNYFNIERTIASLQPEQHYNVVLISVESMSSSFMKAFGNNQNLTPYLDSLAKKSLFFTNFYAAGTRTVRGLEALTLSLPPTPGQSTIKQTASVGMFSLGSIFKSKGYTTQFMYGGNSNFDNMKAFFGGNGYTVIDYSALQPKDIHYENVWGVADEDLFTLAIHTLDKNAALQKPFFTHIMTVSNHRPFTYPEGRINIPAASQSREGSVKYTDWAINRFIKEASTKPWFDNTIFVIVSDHCAGSAGSVELPVTGYHIPLIVFAPKLVQPQVFSGIASQVDVAPTLLGLLHFNYRSKFFGQDVLHIPATNQRAFISTYEGLGFLQSGKLVIQEPVKKVKEFVPAFSTGDDTPTPLTDSLVKKAIAYYQCASWLLKNKRYTAE